MKEFKAWAIDCNHGTPYSYLGIYAFGRTPTLPHQDGCRTALFRTREEATTALKAMKTRAPHYFPKARVRRVTVTVSHQ